MVLPIEKLHVVYKFVYAIATYKVQGCELELELELAELELEK